MSSGTRDPFLTGNFAPWPSEGEHFGLPISGAIPPDLQGTFYRNGPNPAFPPLGRYHWFDGDGMVHAISLGDGQAWYRNRWVVSRGLEEERRVGRALYYGLLELGKAAGKFKNAANTNVIFHSGRLLALYEAALPTELDPQSLATVGEYDFAGRLTGPMTAHPKVEPNTGELWFFGYQPIPPFLTLHRVGARGELLESRPIDAEWPSMVHDFALTERYAVFFVFPIVFRLEHLGTNKPLFVWEEERGSRVGVVPLHGTAQKVRWFEAPSGYVFHFMNAFEEGERIVVDAARYPRLLFMNPPELGSHDFERDQPSLYRFEIDLVGGITVQRQVDDRLCEFPRIREDRLGRPYRYGYSVTRTVLQSANGVPEFDAIARYDWRSGRTQVRSFGKQAGVGEPVFVPRVGAEEEDDGYVLVLVYDRVRDTSDFYVLSAQEITEDPVAVVHLPHRIPYGFHGNWVPISA